MASGNEPIAAKKEPEPVEENAVKEEPKTPDPAMNKTCEPCSTGAFRLRQIIVDLKSMGNREGLLRLGVLAWTVLACCISYSTYAFVVYLPALRDRFLMSQSQAEFCMSLTWLGMGSPIFLGFFINRWGPRWGAFVALLLSAGAYMLIWSACIQAGWYQQHVYAVAFYCLLGGAGSGATSIVGISAAMRNFTATYRGTIMMFLTSGTALGGLIYKAIYNGLVTYKGNDPEHEDLSDYFIVVGVSFLVVNAGGILFYGCYLDEDAALDEESHLIDGTGVAVRYTGEGNDSDTGTANKDNEEGKNDADSAAETSSEHSHPASIGSVESRYYPENFGLSLKQTLSHPMFHFISWPCILTQGMWSMTINNVVVFLESFQLMQWRVSMPYTADVAQMICRPIVGFSSDLIKHRVNRAWFILVGCILDLAIFVLDVFYLDQTVLLFINMFVLGYACVATFTMTPSLLCDEFGVTRFPRNWGMVQGANCVAMFLFCNLVSLFYQHYEDEELGICLSIFCYSWTYAIASVFAVLAVILIAIYIYRKRRGRAR